MMARKSLRIVVTFALDFRLHGRGLEGMPR